MKPIKPKKILRKRFIAAESDSLVIETIQSERVTSRQRLRIVKLKGTWRANKYNELVFEVGLDKGPPETYTFKGSWKLNSNQQIEYVFENSRDRLTFKGYWEIPSSNRLVYILEGSSLSRFEFRVQLESTSLYPQDGQIRYRIGIGYRQNRLTASGQPLILYGEWKFGRNLELNFQMNYGQGRIKVITFGTAVNFDRNKVIFALRSELGKPLGVSLTMTHRFLKSFDAEAFIRLKSRRGEHGVETGLTVPF
jgi:hypothetical protein